MVKLLPHAEDGHWVVKSALQVKPVIIGKVGVRGHDWAKWSLGKTGRPARLWLPCATCTVLQS